MKKSSVNKKRSIDNAFKLYMKIRNTYKDAEIVLFEDSFIIKLADTEDNRMTLNKLLPIKYLLGEDEKEVLMPHGIIQLY